MNINRIRLITLFTLVTLVITPSAFAKIYKCDGPDGPIYTDRECGPNAEDVELLESSGLSGVSEEDKSVLADKKLEREQARSQNQRSTTVNSQNNTYVTESAGRWVRGRNRPLDRERPSNLPVKPRPVTPRKKR